MEDLISALKVFARYQEATHWPTNCSHDQLAIMDVTRDQMSDVDIATVEALDFIWDADEEYWFSFRFGSA
jgi:anti-sigma regulatory factor (Ser/Thr protein kinase)